MESRYSYTTDIRRLIPRDVPGDRVGVSPERPCKNHRLTSPRRDLPLTCSNRGRHQLEHYCGRKPQLDGDCCLARALLLCSSRLDTSLSHNKARSLGPITATPIARSPAAGKVTSQGRTIPRKAQRIDSLRPLAPAVAPAWTWVVDNGAPK